MAALAEAEGELDERFEYDAPRFYDFDEGSPAGAQPDQWFDTDGPKGLATPLKPASDKEAEHQGAAAGVAGVENPQHQAEPAGKGGKGKGGGAEWRRALAAITNTKGQQGAAAAQPAAKHNARKAAAVPAGGDEPAAGPSSKSRQAAAKQQRQQHATGDAAASISRAAASSPRLHSRQRAHPGELKTSEQLELEAVAREKEEAARLRRRNAQAVKHVLQPAPPPVVYSSKPLTEPVGVELCTSKRRRRMHSMETRSMGSPDKSRAEQIAAYEGRMPGKSRLGEGGSSSGAAAAAAAAVPAPAPRHHHQQHGMGGLTVPLSPQFATKRRVRPARFKPREEVEAEQMAAMPKFKARPLNKRMMEDRSGQRGLPHVDARPPTVPAPFAFKTDQRAVEHAGPSSSSAAAAAAAGAGDDVFVFGAQGEGGRLTRSRAKQPWTGHLTQMAPFQLATDIRGAIKRSAVAEPQQEQQDAHPAKRARNAAPGPFQLATDMRGAAEEARLAGIRRQQEEVARQEAQFKALPLNKAALAGAWKPAPLVMHALTVPEEVVLRSDARAAQRREFDATVAARQAQLEAEHQALLQAQEEEEEARQPRRALGHKPLPGRL